MAHRSPYADAFDGRIARTVQESEPWWPASVVPEGAPNVVVLVLDDTGFAHLGCYGSALTTPHIDAIAAKGLRYTGFPNMRGAIPKSAATLAEVLRDNGYATYAAGKWHLAPMADRVMFVLGEKASRGEIKALMRTELARQ